MLSHKQLFLANQAQTTHFPLMLEIVKAEGNYLYDVDGKRYLDLISGISVSSLGHGNEKVKNAIKSQVDAYMHLMVYGEYVQHPQVLLTQKLCSLLPASLDSVYLVNSGAEAVDAAMKLAKRVTGKSEIIACRNAYHGSTHAALSLNSSEYYKNAFRPLLPGINFIDYNSIESLTQITHSTAAVIVEVVQGEGGYIAGNTDFLSALKQKCDECCALLIFDEIQTGMGKTGKLFAFEHHGIVPDILLLGKALGAGMPIGAFVTSRNKMMLLADNPILGHITTFGGHPVVAAAALAGIEELLDNAWMKEVEKKEAIFRQRLVHPNIVSVSGKGLMLGVQLHSFEQNLRVIQACIKEGLITDWFLFANNKIRIAPPLTINESEIHWACDVILRNL